MRTLQLMRPGFSLIGLLVTMACIVVLASFMLSSLNVATTGAGNTIAGSVASIQDEMNLAQLTQSLLVSAQESRRGMFVPSDRLREADWSVNTSAAFWSGFIAARYCDAKQLISSNEHSPWVERYERYDFERINAAAGVAWDPGFKADLRSGSNVSFAHMPLFGQRYERHWRDSTLDSRFPLLGTRGPRGGQPNPNSFTNGRNGQWAGHWAFADGHVEYLSVMAPLSYARDGSQHSDNVYALEDGENGGDAILAFTELMTADGPVLQWD